jgi:hypothetical protein
MKTTALAAGAVMVGLGGLGGLWYVFGGKNVNVDATASSEDEKEKRLPFTERANEMTNEIDTVSADGVVRILRQTDAQIYEGWREHVGLLDPRTRLALEKVAAAVQSAVAKHKAGSKTKIICAGCGTSGRVAFQVQNPRNNVNSPL